MIAIRIVILLLVALWAGLATAQDLDVQSLLDGGEKALDAGRLQEAETKLREALRRSEAAGGPDNDHAYIARAHLANALADLNKLAEAERVIREQLDSARRSYGEESLMYASPLVQLAGLVTARNDDAAAERLYRRAIAILEALPDGDAQMLYACRIGLAATLTSLGRRDEADALLKSVEGGNPEVEAMVAASARLDANDFDGAITLMNKSLALSEQRLGPDNHQAAIAKSAIASALLNKGEHLDTARQLIDEALQSETARFGAMHPNLVSLHAVAASLNFTEGKWEAAIASAAAATGIVEHWAQTYVSKAQKTALELESSQAFNYQLQAFAAWQVYQQQPDRLLEMMEIAFSSFQRAQNPQAATALLRMADRRAEADPDFARLMRRFQDLSQKVAAEAEQQVLRAAEPGNDQVYSGVTPTEVELAKVKAEIERRFAKPGQSQNAVLTLAEAQVLLKPGEGLIAISEGFDAAGAGMAIAVTRDYAWWVPVDGVALREATRQLRQSLGAASNVRGMAQADDEARDTDAAGFDFAASAAVYQPVFGPLEEVLSETRELVVVPSPGLFDIPFTALVREVPVATSPTILRDADWLIRTHAISVLPSVASLKALRSTPHKTTGTRPLAGFGNAIFAGRTAALAPLPDTADELQRMTAELPGRGNALFLGSAATETAVETGALDRFGVLAFATHGLKAGELTGLDEPALALTPDDRNDGLLTASEVAGLNLDADWVILSACNTASGGGPGSEGFSGLARAFLYAGARSLLVSHWPVYSDAAVKLTTGAFAALAGDPAISRAEALRRSMLQILDTDPEPRHWHPSYWAPFALLGDGG
ncbi:MAG: CHAT domain-containing protein [Alphaproteobacteria bacterium]|nr:CHAT domain-containing protein [Alphaproteobacteria bacterium]